MRQSEHFSYLASRLPALFETWSETETEILLDSFYNIVFKFSRHYVVEFGKQVDLIEGEGMLFAQREAQAGPGSSFADVRIVSTWSRR